MYFLFKNKWRQNELLLANYFNTKANYTGKSKLEHIFFNNCR